MNALDELQQAGGQLAQFFTPAYVAQAKAYLLPWRIRTVFDFIDSFAQYAVLLLLGLHLRIFKWCDRVTDRLNAGLAPEGTLDGLRKIFARVWKGPGFGSAFLFVLAVEGLLTLILIPEWFYFGYWREKREGLSHYTVATWSVDVAKHAVGDVVGKAILLCALYALMRRMPRHWYKVLAVVIAGAMLVAPFFDTFRASIGNTETPLADGPERRAVLDVLHRGDIAFDDILVENTSRTTARANAYVSGEGPTRQIVISDTLLGKYTPREIAAAVAHEVGHLGERAWPSRIGAALALVLALLGLQRFMAYAARRQWFGLTSPHDIVGYMVMFLVFECGTAIANPFSNAWTRQKELDADAYALRLNRDPEAFTSMMVKLTGQNRADPIPPRWLELWAMDHPPTARRIAQAMRFAAAEHLPFAAPLPQDVVPVAAAESP